jgi:hypothetical protein
MALEDLNPVNAHLFAENRWQDHFERLRNEDPVHFNEIQTAGRYWSLTKYKDIKAVDSDFENFSSASGITLGFAKGTQLPPGSMMQSGANSAFISQDPPRHDEQRKTVQGVVAPANLVNLEPLIRERTCKVLDSLPEAEHLAPMLSLASSADGGPDVVIVPTGDGVILAGVAKGFADLVRGGLLEAMPRLIAVQPEGSAAIVDALRDVEAGAWSGPLASGYGLHLVLVTDRVEARNPGLDEVRPAGFHRVGWDGQDDDGRRLARGVYHLRLSAGGRTATRSMVLLRP